MLCKQLVSATQGLQPKLVPSRDALPQPVLIQASALLLLFHLLCSTSSSPRCRSRVRPVRVAVPTPHTHHCPTPLFSCPVRAPCSHTALGNSSQWEGLGQPRMVLRITPARCPPPAPCLDPSCSCSTTTFLLLLPRSPRRGFLATNWSKLLAAH